MCLSAAAQLKIDPRCPSWSWTFYTIDHSLQRWAGPFSSRNTGRVKCWLAGRELVCNKQGKKCLFLEKVSQAWEDLENKNWARQKETLDSHSPFSCLECAEFIAGRDWAQGVNLLGHRGWQCSEGSLGWFRAATGKSIPRGENRDPEGKREGKRTSRIPQTWISA